MYLTMMLIVGVGAAISKHMVQLREEEGWWDYFWLCLIAGAFWWAVLVVMVADNFDIGGKQ